MTIGFSHVEVTGDLDQGSWVACSLEWTQGRMDGEEIEARVQTTVSGHFCSKGAERWCSS